MRVLYCVTLLFVATTTVAGSYGTKTNIVHDLIGAKILTENGVEYQKIVTTQKSDVIFCDKNRSLFFFRFEDKKVIPKGKNKKECYETVLTDDGVKKTDGAGKLLGKLFFKDKTNTDNLKDTNKE